MSWTYDTSLSTNKDKVRLRIMDTDTTQQEFSDEEINATLNDVAQDVVQAAYRLVRSLAIKYARIAKSKKAGPYSEDTTKRAEIYRDLAESLADEADEPWEEIAEITHDEPSERAFIEREDLRGQI